jgi:catechol 2,3-dioxygenase-like lactoylglutathione lyase family enzyme
MGTGQRYGEAAGVKRYLAIAAFACVIPVAGYAQPAPPAKPVIQDGQVIAPIYRVNLYVRDINAALTLYRDVLRLKPVSDRQWHPMDHGLKTDIEVREVILTAGNPAVGNLGLYEIKGQKEPVQKPFLESFGHTGDAATVWNTKDIWKISDEVKAAGYVVLAHPVTILANPNMLVQNVEMQFRDRDGFLVNLLQAGIAKDSPEAATAKIPDRKPEVMGTSENTWAEARMPRVATKEQPESVYPGFRVAPMNRSTTFIRDRDQSFKFYHDILGTRHIVSNYIRGVGINRIKNTEGLEQWVTLLMAGDTGDGRIGIYRLYNEKVTFRPPNMAPAPQVGDRGIVFVTNDLENLYKKYKEAGFINMAPPTAVKGTDGKPATTEMMFRDPDGTIITFIQEGQKKAQVPAGH